MDRWWPGQPLTIYNVAEDVGNAFYKAFTPSNIIKGFEVPDIYPINENVFREDEILTHITNRPLHSTDMFNKTAKSCLIKFYRWWQCCLITDVLEEEIKKGDYLLTKYPVKNYSLLCIWSSWYPCQWWISSKIFKAHRE